MKSAPNKACHEGRTETFAIFDVHLSGQMRLVEQQQREGLAHLLAGGGR